MRYVKMLGLLAVAAAALMAFAGTASATLTEAAGDPVDIGDTVHASSNGATSLTGTIAITCQKSTVSGKVTSNESKVAKGNVESLTFTECGNHTVTVKNGGSLEITNKGQVSSTGAEVTVLLHSALLGTVHCIYTTSSTTLGVLTNSLSPTSTIGVETTATLHVNSVSIPRSPTDGACGEHSTWEGTYAVDLPHALTVH